MNGWLLGLIVALALFAGAGAMAYVQLLLGPCRARPRAGRHSPGTHDPSSGPGAVPAATPPPGPELASPLGAYPPERHHEPEPWYQKHGPGWDQQQLLTAPPAGDPRDRQWRDMSPARVPGYLG